jgi:hypothetical protein
MEFALRGLWLNANVRNDSGDLVITGIPDEDLPWPFLAICLRSVCGSQDVAFRYQEVVDGVQRVRRAVIMADGTLIAYDKYGVHTDWPQYDANVFYLTFKESMPLCEYAITNFPTGNNLSAEVLALAFRSTLQNHFGWQAVEVSVADETSLSVTNLPFGGEVTLRTICQAYCRVFNVNQAVYRTLDRDLFVVQADGTFWQHYFHALEQYYRSATDNTGFRKF